MQNAAPIQVLRQSLGGVLGATVTPILDDGFTVDWSALETNALWLVDQSIRLLVVNGSIGEYPLLSLDDRTLAVTRTVAATGDRAVVVSGCSDASPNNVLRLAEASAKVGASAAMISVPHYFKLTAPEIADYFHYIDERTPLPFLLYNNPGLTGLDLSLDLLEDIASCSNFVGFKDATSNVLLFHETCRRFSSRFPIVAANESFLFPMLAAGAYGCMTATAAFAPSVLFKLMAAMAAGDLTVARELFEDILAFRQLFRGDYLYGNGNYIQYTKAAMNLVGLRGGRPHFPMAPLDIQRIGALAPVLQHQLHLTIAGFEN